MLSLASFRYYLRTKRVLYALIWVWIIGGWHLAGVWVNCGGGGGGGYRGEDAADTVVVKVIDL